MRFGRGILLSHALSTRAADRADAGEAGRRDSGGRRVSLRAEVGRVSRDRVPRRRRRGLHPEPRSRGRSTAIFPSCTPPSRRALPGGCVVDGEIVIAAADGLDFDALQLRLHPAASRVAKLAAGDARRRSSPSICSRPAAASVMAEPQATRRAALERLLADGGAAGLPHADDARPRRGHRVAAALRRRRPRRRHRQAGRRRRTSPASAR